MEGLRSTLLVSIIGNILSLIVGVFVGVIVAVITVLLPEWVHRPALSIRYVQAIPLARPFSFDELLFVDFITLNPRTTPRSAVSYNAGMCTNRLV